MTLNDFAVIIPSLNPDEKLKTTVQGMLDAGFKHIVLVNDGSDAEHKQPFDELAQLEECTVLIHNVNEGKGQALKTAFNYIDEEMHDIDAVITVDGDGQHTPEDTVNVAYAMMQDNDKVVLGCRDFSDENVPFHNRFGNRTTSKILKALCDIELSDTQTGLRGIPSKYLGDFCRNVDGDRYEYETNMLIYMHDKGIEFVELPIATVYIDDNKSSHFKVVGDSWRIYRHIFVRSSLSKQFVSSLICTLVDLILFRFIDSRVIVNIMFIQTMFATFGARIISSLLNYILNKMYVFKSKAKIGKSMSRFAKLVVAQAVCSWLLISIISALTGCEGIARTLVKALIDLILFVASYFIQKKWVFKVEDN